MPFEGSFSSQGDEMLHMLGVKFLFVTLGKIRSKPSLYLASKFAFPLPFCPVTLAALPLHPSRHCVILLSYVLRPQSAKSFLQEGTG